MRLLSEVLITSLLAVQIAAAQSDRDFSGPWKLNLSRSDVRGLPAPAPFLKVEQSGATLTLVASSDETGPSTLSIYPLDDRSEKRQTGDSTTNTKSKWEGAALLVSTLVSGPQNYAVMERWTRSRDGNTLTIQRTIERIGSESESMLIYENPSATLASSAPPPERAITTQPLIPRAPKATDASDEYVVDAGTRVLLRLTNSVNTKHTAPGDRIYLETVLPVFIHGALVIPRGSYVIGTVTDSRQAGRVKGKSALNLRFDSLTLPNGVARDFRSRPGSVDGRGNVDRAEGKIEGEGNKGGDARTIGQTAAAGAGIGTVA